jgi:hypothetical protein
MPHPGQNWNPIILNRQNEIDEDVSIKNNAVKAIVHIKEGINLFIRIKLAHPTCL